MAVKQDSGEVAVTVAVTEMVNLAAKKELRVVVQALSITLKEEDSEELFNLNLNLDSGLNQRALYRSLVLFLS